MLSLVDLSRRKKFAGIEGSRNTLHNVGENLKAGQAKQMQLFDVICICGVGVWMKFKSVTYTKGLMVLRRLNGSLCHWISKINSSLWVLKRDINPCGWGYVMKADRYSYSYCTAMWLICRSIVPQRGKVEDWFITYCSNCPPSVHINFHVTAFKSIWVKIYAFLNLLSKIRSTPKSQFWSLRKRLDTPIIGFVLRKCLRAKFSSVVFSEDYALSAVSFLPFLCLLFEWWFLVIAQYDHLLQFLSISSRLISQSTQLVPNSLSNVSYAGNRISTTFFQND